MTAEKTRLKFRVSAYDRIGPGGTPEPRWSEKWGVGLFHYEEFHVTDQLLKLPFQEVAPKTVCIFAVSTGVLAFRLVDPDRRAEVNGIQRREGIVTVGDKIKIGDTLMIEILIAPAKTLDARPMPTPSAVSEAPTFATPRGNTEEGPTLTHTSTVATRKPDPKAAPIFTEMKDHSLEIAEPSFHPSPRPAPQPMFAQPIEEVATSRKNLFPEPKVELATSTHTIRDDSLESVKDDEETGEVDRSGRLTLGERIRGLFAWAKKGVKADGPSPWLTADRVDPGITKMKTASYGAKDAKSAPVPWIPEAFSTAARLRGRALVFLVAAIGTLMIAVGVFRIKNRVAELEVTRQSRMTSTQEMTRGIPIEVLQEKVRRMRRTR